MNNQNTNTKQSEFQSEKKSISKQTTLLVLAAFFAGIAVSPFLINLYTAQTIKTNKDEQKISEKIQPTKSTISNEKTETKSNETLCSNEYLKIKLNLNKDWTCESADDKQGIAELTLTGKNLQIYISNGDRGEPCLGCKTKTSEFKNSIMNITKYENDSENPDGTIIYLGKFAHTDKSGDRNPWISLRRHKTFENVKAENLGDFTSLELSELNSVLSRVEVIN